MDIRVIPPVELFGMGGGQESARERAGNGVSACPRAQPSSRLWLRRQDSRGALGTEFAVDFDSSHWPGLTNPILSRILNVHGFVESQNLPSLPIALSLPHQHNTPRRPGPRLQLMAFLKHLLAIPELKGYVRGGGGGLCPVSYGPLPQIQGRWGSGGPKLPAI